MEKNSLTLSLNLCVYFELNASQIGSKLGMLDAFSCCVQFSGFFFDTLYCLNLTSTENPYYQRIVLPICSDLAITAISLRYEIIFRFYRIAYVRVYRYCDRYVGEAKPLNLFSL
jgi:hypothetical protein